MFTSGKNCMKPKKVNPISLHLLNVNAIMEKEDQMTSNNNRNIGM